MAWAQSFVFWADAWGDGVAAPSPSQNAWGDSWGAAFGDSWGGLEVAPTFTPANVTVRAFRVVFFGGQLRMIGDTFIITTPYQFTPYGMVLVSTPPADWAPLMEAYSKAVDYNIARMPGREETRLPVNGSPTITREAGNPYD